MSRIKAGGVLVVALAMSQAASAFYDANLGRWLNRDPIGEGGGLNLHTFAQNDGINLIDFWGLQCGITLRRYPGGGGHQWISGGGNNVGFYPPGQWRDENGFAGSQGRPDPNDPANYYEWDTKQKKHGSLPDGTPCSAATCAQIIDCINKAINAKPPKFNPVFNNCRQQSKDVLGNCCLSKGSKINKPTGGKGPLGRLGDDSTYGSSFPFGSSR